MSYCVNCGVELDNSLTECPMCQTKVINPNAVVLPGEGISPYPTQKGPVETVRRKDIAILITSILLSVSVISGVLNRISFPRIPWSLAIIGACIILWVILFPVVIHTKQSPYISVLYDGAAASLYLFLISKITPTTEWLPGIGLPIVIATTLVVEGVVFVYRKFPRSFLFNALYIITGIGVLCGMIETIIDYYFLDPGEKIKLVWSAVVIAVCASADIILVTVLSSRRLRNAIRRRLHF